MKSIFVCSPFRANENTTQEEHVLRAEFYCWWVINSVKYDAFAPHLFYTRFLDDNDPEQRKLGIALGMRRLLKSDEIWVFAKDYESASTGMQEEISYAVAYKIPIKYINPENIDVLGEAWRKTRVG